MKYKLPEWRLSRKTVAGDISAWKKKKEETAEKIPVLYAAMIRAQEELFLVAFEEDNAIAALPPGTHQVQSALSYMDWILPALLNEKKENPELSTSYTQASKP